MNISNTALSLMLFLGLITNPLLHAQTTTTTPTDTSVSAATGQAPNDVTDKITELVRDGKYAEAQGLTTGLLLAYPSDQRLIKAKALLEKLLAPAAPATAAPSVTSSNAREQPAVNANAGQLTGMDKVDYNVLLELARQAQQSNDLPQQNKLLQQFMDQSSTFLQKHPDQILIWQLRAAAAISLNEPMKGYEAGAKLLASGVIDSNDPSMQQLLAKLKLLGWLDMNKAQEIQLSLDKDKQQQAAEAEAERRRAEDAKYTFPVAHDGLFGYGGYGHIAFGENEAVYSGSDGTIRFSKSNIHQIKVFCKNGVCGLFFYPKHGSSIGFTAVTEYAVANRTDKGPVFYPASVLGNAVVARWKFVADGNGLKPPTP